MNKHTNTDAWWFEDRPWGPRYRFVADDGTVLRAPTPEALTLLVLVYESAQTVKLG